MKHDSLAPQQHHKWKKIRKKGRRCLPIVINHYEGTNSKLDDAIWGVPKVDAHGP